MSGEHGVPVGGVIVCMQAIGRDICTPCSVCLGVAGFNGQDLVDSGRFCTIMVLDAGASKVGWFVHYPPLVLLIAVIGGGTNLPVPQVLVIIVFGPGS